MNLLKFKVTADEKCDAQKLEIPYAENKTMNAVLYSSKDAKDNAPCILYLHGGGFVLPAAPHHYNNAKKYAVGACCRVLMIDYPLAPKHKFPEGVNASFDAYKWLIKHAKDLSIDASKIIVAGDSAGGNLSTIVCIKALDEQITMPVAQMLLYPSINTGLKTTSMKTFVDTPLCNSEDCKKYQGYYVNKDEDVHNRYFSPIHLSDLSIFPPTYIETAEFDCLRDEARIFARKLRLSNVDVHLNNTKQTMHGYDMVEDSPITIKNMNKRIEFLKKHFS